jgi:hypothetical protein
MTKNSVTEGTHEDHVRAGQQSHKNEPAATGSKTEAASHATADGHGSTHEQQVNAGKQSHKNA